jgi:ABC-2 type transport system ATP-binding protein
VTTTDVAATRPAGTADGAAADGAHGTDSTAIRTTGLTKRFAGGQVAVDGLDLLVPRGALYGFLGPNGSGKTTTIRMLLGLVGPTAGRHDLLGEPMPRAAARVLPRVGALVEGPAFHPYLSGRENLRRLDAGDRTVPGRGAAARVDLALERVGLAAAAGKRYRKYSLGMRQRLGLAAALLRPRDLLVLDEPTNGLDPQGTREVRHLLREVAAEGATVFVSSHLLSEIEQVCTDVGVMSRGRLVFQGSLAQLRAAAGLRVRVETPDPTTPRGCCGGWGPVCPSAEGSRSWPSLVTCRARTSPRRSSVPTWRSASWSSSGRISSSSSSSSPGRVSMSTSELVTSRLTASARPAGARRPDLRLLRSELRLVLRRPRNLALLAVLCLPPTLLGVAVRLAAPTDASDGPPFSGRSRRTGCSSCSRR